MDPLAKLVVPAADRPRRFLAAVAVVLAIALGATAGLNVVVDPRGDFGTDRYRPLVIDVPAEKLALAEAALPTGALILGSSRGMPLPPAALPEPGGFNFAILGGGLLDDRLAYDAAVRLGGAPPQRLVVAIDSFQFMRLPDGSRWSVVLDSSAAASYQGETVHWTERVHLLPQLLSVGYARDSAKVLGYTYVSGYPEGANEFQADGQGLRPATDRAIDAGTYDLQGAFDGNWDRYLGRIYTVDSQADPAATGVLSELVAAAWVDGVEVDLVLMPFWHVALDRLEGNQVFRQFQDIALAAMRAECRAGVHAFDYTRAEAFGGRPDAFYDGYHVTPANGELLLEAVAAGVGDLCS